MKKRTIFLLVGIVAIVLLARYAKGAGDYQVYTTARFTNNISTMNCGNIDSVVFHLFKSGSEVGKVIRKNIDGDTLTTCVWELDTAVSTGGLYSIVTDFWFGDTLDRYISEVVASYSALDTVLANIAIWAGSAAGEGDTPCSLFVIDTYGAAIQGARVTARLASDQTKKAFGWTPSGGYVNFSLEAGETYDVYVSHHSFSASTPAADNWAINDSTSIRMEMTAFDPTAPDTANVCKVYGWIRDISGDMIEGIEVCIDLEVNTTGAIYDTLRSVFLANYASCTPTDSSGYFELHRIPNVLISPTSHYRVTITFYGTELEDYTKLITVPNQTDVNLEDLL